MKYLILVCILVFQTGMQITQADNGRLDDDPVRKFPPIRISIAPLYQEWTRNGVSLQEYSFLATAQFYVQPNLGIGIGFSQASAEGDNLQRINGITDVQLTVNYLYHLNKSRLVFNLGIDIPTGTSQFSESTYQTAVQLAHSQYDFRVPFFGQGSSVSPGVAFVSQVTGRFVTSIGVSYRFRDSFEPISGFSEGYDWGNELLVTAGAAWQVARTLTLTADAILTSYSADKVGEIDLYEPGNRFTGQLQLHKVINVHDLWLTMRFRSIDKNTVFQGESLQAQSVRATPGLVRLSSQFRVRLRPALRATLQVEATRYESDFEFDQLTVFGIGLAPEISLTPAISIPFRARFLFGDLEGFEIGLGLVAVI